MKDHDILSILRQDLQVLIVPIPLAITAVHDGNICETDRVCGEVHHFRLCLPAMNSDVC